MDPTCKGPVGSCHPPCGAQGTPRDADAECSSKNSLFPYAAGRSSSGVLVPALFLTAPLPTQRLPSHPEPVFPHRAPRVTESGSQNIPSHPTARQSMPPRATSKFCGSHQDLLPNRNVRLGKVNGLARGTDKGRGPFAR